ncbi:MAG: hypothetical protein QXV37_02285, partial [Candidatus Jordarchaeaceae archaeon]
KMVRRVNHFLQGWRLYGFHGGLRGNIKGPNDFVIEGRKLSIDECVQNISKLSRILEEENLLFRVALENIYGADIESPSIGMDKNELDKIARHIGILLDLGHMAVNCAYRNIELDHVSFNNLPLREIHISFLRPEIKKFSAKYLDKNLMYWDHYPYSETEVNQQILRAVERLRKRTELITVEISAPLEEMKSTLELLQFLRHKGENTI